MVPKIWVRFWGSRALLGCKDFILGSFSSDKLIVKSLEACVRLWGSRALLGSKDFNLGKFGSEKLILKSLEA